MNSNRRRLIDRKSNLLAAAIFCALGSMQAGAAGPAAAPASSEAAAPAEAAEAADATVAGSAGAKSIKGVVVKAQKREQAAIEVPASVTAVDAHRLARSGATQLEDYTAQVPGMAS